MCVEVYDRLFDSHVQEEALDIFELLARVLTHGVHYSGSLLFAGMDRNVPLAEPTTRASIIDDSRSDFRIITSSLGLLSAIALLLGLVGLYGVLAY